MTSDGYPLGADCDMDALVEWRHRERMRNVDVAIKWATDFLFDVITPPFMPRPGTREHFLPTWDIP